MYYTTIAVSVPTAYVTKNRQRIKQNNQTVYLKNGDEFEIELFNPTQNKVLAKIEINGNPIGNTGLVLKPGQRVFLERYFNEPKKFLFETYKVSGNSDEVKQAISNNGDVVVKFFNEQLNYNITQNPTFATYNSTNDTYCINLPSNTTKGININSFGTCTTSYGGGIFTNTSSTYGTLNINNTNKKPRLRSTTHKKKEIETGRIEKGSTSEQKFVNDNTTFTPYHFAQSVWKILPMSQKEITTEDLVVYCTECGSKRKKDSFKFCPHCGTKY